MISDKSRLLHKRFMAFYKQAIAISATYRAQAILWMISKIMPLIMMMIWLHLAKDKPIGGYDAHAFSVYYMFLFVAYQLTPIWAIYRMDQNIRQGNLAPQLMRPIDPMWHLVAEHWGEMTVRLPIILAIFALGVLLTGIYDAIEWYRLPLFIFAIFVGWWVTFALHYALAALVFWTDSITYFDSLIYRLFILFGGVSLPLTFYPSWVQDILYFSPFPYVFYFPTRLMIGEVAGAEMMMEFAIAIMWIIIFTLLHRFLWGLGLKRFSAVGQ